jgi:hypothetical protein
MKRRSFDTFFGPILRLHWVGYLVCASLQSFAAQADSTAAPASIEAWKKFRLAQPFQTQIIALSPPVGRQPRTLIISEPSPQSNEIRLKEILGAHLSGCERRKWSVMSGGSVSDLVCTVINTDRIGWPDTLARAQVEALGSSDGAPVVSLPAPTRKMIAHSLDLRYSAKDLHSWLVGGKQRFSSSPIAPWLTFNELMTGGVRGVFKSEDGSLTVWAIAREASIDEGSRADIRRFSVDGDLILGAVANKQTVLIVARTRIEPLAHLPPLRSETILLLAGSSERELAQSYERNDMIAGKGLDGVDRAPILLSPQLIDTEFGTLLNIADQLLKGWSSAGNIRYAEFKYPVPRSYPFGAVPASKVKPDREEFLFNWNTDGAAYRQTIGGLDVVAPQRTGSLSVIYGDVNDRPRDMEDVAYDYFARSGDTTLIRVVQYTLLYQIFRQFDIKASPPPVSARYKQFSANVEQATRRQFKYLLSDISEPQLKSYIRAYWTNRVSSALSAALASQGIRPSEYIDFKVKTAMNYAGALREAQLASGGEVSNALAELAAQSRRRSASSSQDDERLRSALRVLLKHLDEALASRLLENEAEALRRSGLIQVAMSQPGGWDSLKSTEAAPGKANHTAYVVESHPQGSLAAAVGGHNLSAPMVRFNADASVAKGQVIVRRADDGSWVVDHHPADSDRLRTIAREVGTRKELDKEVIEAKVAEALKGSRPEAPVTLGAIRQVTGSATEFKNVSAVDSAYQIRKANPSEIQKLSAMTANHQDAIVMEQGANGAFTLSRAGSPNTLQVSSVTAATDALANGLISSAGGRGSVSILIKGVPEDKAEAMLSYVQASLRRRSKSSVDHVLASSDEFMVPTEQVRLLNQKIANNGLRIDRSGIKTSKISGGQFEGFTRVEVPITVEAKTPWHLKFTSRPPASKRSPEKSRPSCWRSKVPFRPQMYMQQFAAACKLTCAS